MQSDDGNAVRSIALRSSLHRPLDTLDEEPGIPLANIDGMPDVQVSVDPKSLPTTAPQPAKNWWAIGLAVVLGLAGTIAWLSLEHRSSATAETTVALETFVVNLTGSGQRAYLRIGITLGLAHPLSSRNLAEAVPMALVRDTILSVLATAQPEALLQLEGKRVLKNDLLKALQERVPQLAIQNVYFTEFLVQM